MRAQDSWRIALCYPVQDQAGLDRVRPLIADLQQLVHGLPASAAAQGAAHGNGAGAGGSENGDSHGGAASSDAEDGEVVDAEFTRD